jgi:membrane protease YdiL (CAAX protease family)
VPLFLIPAPAKPDESHAFGARFFAAFGLLFVAAFVSVWVPVTDPWLTLSGVSMISVSLGCGLLIAAAAVFATRRLLQGPSGQELFRMLRPDVAAPAAYTLYAVVAALGEELLFRQILLSWVGLWVSSLAFALVHRMRGNGGTLWTLCSGVLGVALGASVQCTGSIAGAVLAHILINVLNAHWLRTAGHKRTAVVSGLLGLRQTQVNSTPT